MTFDRINGIGELKVETLKRYILTPCLNTISFFYIHGYPWVKFQVEANKTNPKMYDKLWFKL